MKERILFIAHFTEIEGPVQAFIKYLRDFSENPYIITHPMAIAEHTISGNISEKDIFSSFFTFDSKKEKKYFDRRKCDKPITLFTYLKQLFYTLKIIRKRKKKFDIIVAADNLNALAAIILKKLGYTKKVAYYVIDYTPTRFYNKILNYIYHALDRYCVRNVDCVWNISERIRQVRVKQGQSKKSIVVPVGVYGKEFLPIKNWKKNEKILVYAGSISISKGVQLLIDSMQDIAPIIPDVRAHIIGSGPYEQKLKDIVKKKGLQKYVKFFGFMKREELLNKLVKCRVGIATYKESADSYTIYADPTKPKEYLACGLPVIITRVPSTSEDVAKFRLGRVINYKKEEMIESAIKLLIDDKEYGKCRENALKYMGNFKWETIFKEAFDKSLVM